MTECNITRDTVCECNIDFFYDESKQACEICDSCKQGFGALRRCTGTHNSVCMRCGNRTFSDKTSAISICKPCSKCFEKQVETKSCTPEQDTECTGMYIQASLRSSFQNRKSFLAPFFKVHSLLIVMMNTGTNVELSLWNDNSV